MKRKRKEIIICFSIFISIVAALGACNSGNNNPIPEKHHIEIIEMKFKPNIINVNKGDTIVFINKDMVMHDITEEVNKSWTSKPIQSEASWKMIATKSEGYFCSLHPVMRGKIVIKEKL